MDADVPSLNHLRELANTMGGGGSGLSFSEFGAGVGRSASFDDELEEEEEEEESVNDPRLKWDFLKTLDRERAWVWRKSLLPSFPGSYLGGGGEDDDGGYAIFRRPDVEYFGRVGVELTEFFWCDKV